MKLVSFTILMIENDGIVSSPKSYLIQKQKLLIDTMLKGTIIYNLIKFGYMKLKPSM